MSKIKRLAGETVLYGLGSILPRFLNFLLVRLHTTIFLPDAYGVITKLFAYMAVINVVLMFGMETAYFRYAAKPDADEKKIFNTAQTFVIGISFLTALICFLFSKPIATALLIADHPEYISWLAFILFTDAVVAIPFARLRLQKKALQFAAGKLINIGLLVGLNLYFLKVAYNAEIGIGYVILANLIANGFYLIFFSKTLLSWRPAYDNELSPLMTRYAYPIMITGLAGMTNEMFSRVTLEWWLPYDFYPGQSAEYALGIFGACFKFAVLMNLVVQAFRYAAEPFFFSNAHDKNSPVLFARVNHYFVIVCCLLLLTVSINLDILKYFLKREEYWVGLNIVPILLLAYLFLGVYYNMSVWFKLADKTYFGTIITIGGTIITFAANYLLIPQYGYWGSSWATLLCYGSMTIACYLIGQRYYPIPYNIGRSIGYIAVTIFIIYLVNSVAIDEQWMATSFHAMVILLFMIVLFFIERKGLTKGTR